MNIPWNRFKAFLFQKNGMICQNEIPAKRDDPGLKMGAAGRRFCGGKK
jgi:hypothetical protein